MQNEKEKESSTIYQTLTNIERRTNHAAFNGYKKFYKCENPVAVIKYKVNTSRLTLNNVLKNLNLLEERLNLLGAGLMSIDYTRDLSGVLEKERMIKHFLKLGFIEQSNSEEENKKSYIVNEFTKFKTWEEKTLKDDDENDFKNQVKIIDTDTTCGRNTFKYIRNIGPVCCVVKYYNKIVSNFEAGDVQKKIGTHLAEYAFTHSCEHLEKTFRHPDVVERGLTRLEISLHGFNPKINYCRMLEDEFNLVKDAKIFHIQPGAEQWLRLAKHITQCTLFSNKATQEISLFWYGSSLTKRVAGVTKKLKKRNIDENPKEWEHAKKWMMLNFGFSGVPIYNISLDVKNVLEEKKILIKRKIKTEPKQEEQEEQPKQLKQPKQPKQPKQEPEPKQEPKAKQEQPKRRQGRPTKKEEEERRSKLTEEEKKKEDEEKERKRKQREEQKKIKAEELRQEIERRKKLTREERQREEEERQEEEKRKQREREERKKPKYELVEEVYTEEKLKLFITDFTYHIKKGPTFLTPFNKPSKMYMSTRDKEVKEPPCPKNEIYKYPSQILPETENIQWRFRVEPDHKRTGLKKLPKFPFQCFNNPNKKISTMSTRERNTFKFLEQENEKSKE